MVAEYIRFFYNRKLVIYYLEVILLSFI